MSDDYDEVGGQDGWSNPRYLGNEEDDWVCRYPGQCVMGASMHNQGECTHIDDAAHFFEMMEEFNNTTRMES